MSANLALAQPVAETRKPKAALGINEFKRIKAVMIAKTGITLGDDKINLVHSRLQKRMRELGFTLLPSSAALRRVSASVYGLQGALQDKSLTL